MRKVKSGTLYRVLDANFNRAKEGFRVCEDICRFVIDSKSGTKDYKDLRHDLTQAISALGLKDLIVARNIEGDVGKKSNLTESKREKVSDIFYANSQRVKESVRVIEEFAKMIDSKAAFKIKNIRYKVYALEKKIIVSL